MAITYEIIRRKTKAIETGSLHYKTVEGFITYRLHADKDNEFKAAYNDGDTIILYKDGEHAETFRKVPTVYADKWDNYNSDAPQRMDAINEALAMLIDFDKVSVSFDYEGRTRHETAAHVFMKTMQELGHMEFDFNIGYNYLFTIERVDSK